MDPHDSSHFFHHPYHQQQPTNHNVAMFPQHISLTNTSYLLQGGNTSATNSPLIQQQQQSSKFGFNSSASKVLDHNYSDGSPSASVGSWLGIEPAKKKRGRPRKYSPDNTIGLGLSSVPGAQVEAAVDSGAALSSETPLKRNRGRPPGSVKIQMNALGVPGAGFTPHVIIVNQGEDIVSKIMDFSQQGPRNVCILSATGSVSNANLQQTAMSAAVAYEGRFDIISLSGSFPLPDSNSSSSSGLSVSLSSSDGKVLGGGVAGILKAASSVQIIVGSFTTEVKKQKNAPSANPSSHLLDFSTPRTGPSPSSRGGSSDSADENGDTNAINRGHGLYSNLGQPIQSIPLYSMGYSMNQHPTR